MIPTYLSSQHQGPYQERRSIRPRPGHQSRRPARPRRPPGRSSAPVTGCLELLDASPGRGYAYPQGWARGNDPISAGIALVSGDADIAEGPLLIMVLETIPGCLIY